MNDYTKLIELMKLTNQFQPNADVSTDEVVAAIEAHAAEIENWKKANRAISVLNKSLVAERDALQAKLTALEKQEPVAWIEWDLHMDEGDPDSIVAGCNKPDVACDGWEWRPLYASPVVQQA